MRGLSNVWIEYPEQAQLSLWGLAESTGNLLLARTGTAKSQVWGQPEALGMRKLWRARRRQKPRWRRADVEE